MPKSKDERLLVGFEETDDAAVVKLSDDTALIQTLDFFPSMVNDPYLFGLIAATNALSDVYAMGGEALVALNIVTYPDGEDMTMLKDILRGGAEKVIESGAMLAGGHSINDPRVKYGLSVTGTVHPDRILKNNTCQEGDMLILTKPIGVGLVAKGYGTDKISAEEFEPAKKQMTWLNKYAADMMRKYPVSSCTDVTGFGLAGHLSEMLDGRLSAELTAADIPVLDAAYTCLEQGVTTSGGKKNREYLLSVVDFRADNPLLEEIIYDPQTSGGLLIAIPEAEGAELLKELSSLAIPSHRIGTVTARQEWEIIVK